MENEIKVCKLVTGELIIGTFNGENTYDITDIMHITFHQGDSAEQVGIGLAPYIPFIGKGDTVNISPENILMWVDTYPPVITEQYVQMTSNIILPGLELPS
jgi:hypothetical protein